MDQVLEYLNAQPPKCFASLKFVCHGIYTYADVCWFDIHMINHALPWPFVAGQEV